jgi:hypothetical protein
MLLAILVQLRLPLTIEPKLDNGKRLSILEHAHQAACNGQPVGTIDDKYFKKDCQ